MADDPYHFDAKIAGWWVWGQCCWIGGGWCNDSRGEHRCAVPQLPKLDGENGVNSLTAGRPNLADAFDIGRGVNASADHVNGSASTAAPWLGTCDARRAWLTDWTRRLADRLRLVRTCYGHWSRVCDSDSTLTRLGTTGVFLDPPYPSHSTNGKKSRDPNLYATDQLGGLDALRDEVLAWCRKWGQDKLIRVAVCGYEGDGYEALESEGWTVTAWEAGGGYANQRRGGKGKSENAKRERIWWSPACITQAGLFDEVPEAS